jgi:hypothetical protein
MKTFGRRAGKVAIIIGVAVGAAYLINLVAARG